ncbi:MAG: TRAP transporter substrate-binding protein DctP [Micrococcaceae bacterium]
MKKMNRKSVVGSLAGFAAATLLLTSCGDGGGAGDDVEGFEFGASQEEVNAAIEGLEPVSLNYQPAATGAGSPQGQAAVALKEAIEERSNGQIELELVWGRAIAGYDEVDDALADGRLDLSFTVPSYDPSVYPVHNAFSQATVGFPTSPIVGNAVTGAVLTELSYADEIRAEFEEKGLVPLHPAFGTSTYYTYCSQPIESIDDWSGLQLRVGGQQHHTTMNALGASPTSMSATEVYDALQRSTVDCEFGRVPTTLDYGVIEIAPHIGYSDEESAFADLVFGSLVAGSNFERMPLPYQQIVFDSIQDAMEGVFESTIESMNLAAEESEANGGSVEEFDDETKSVIREVNEQFRQSTIDDGVLPEGFMDEMDESVERWTGIVTEELGYEDAGEFADISSWYTGGTDWTPIGERIQEDILLPYRPGQS